MKCIICEDEVSTPYYSDVTCDKCGQVYTYDEGHVIKLTAEQVDVLNQLSLHVDKEDIPTVIKGRHEEEPVEYILTNPPQVKAN